MSLYDCTLVCQCGYVTSVPHPLTRYFNFLGKTLVSERGSNKAALQNNTVYCIQYHLPIVLVCFGPRGILSDPPVDHPLCRLPIALSVPSTIADVCGDTSESLVLRLVRTGTTYGGRNGGREGGREGGK